MEIRVLKYFLAVAREQNISAAAQSLFLSQPTLSRQLKELEEELGKQLFIRGSRKIALTEEGLLLRKRAEEIVELLDKTEKELSNSDEQVSGEIYIGAGETDGLRLIAKAAKELQEQYPQITYRIISGDAVDITERLDKGLIDFALLLEPVDISKYSYLKFPVKDVWGVLMRRDCPLAEKKSISPKDLQDMPLIVSRQALDGSELTQWLKNGSEQLNIVSTYNLVYNASLMVDEGLGVALCLDKIINVSGDSSLCFRPLKPRLEVGMNLVWKKYQVFSKAAEKFILKMQESVNSLQK
ncbi:MAG: LysR family transcriptional regulator [Ruminococcus sp.]|nr:LysR family transcriptional regulator [Ruminococcus sp.]